MKVEPQDVDLLKTWIIKKLENIADADPDVLADYVLALVNTKHSDPVAKAACVADLKDFVPIGTEQFVDEVFATIATKSFDPSRPPLKHTAPTFQPSKRTKATSLTQPPQSKKRSHSEREEQTSDEKWLHDRGNEGRPVKQARRGGRGREQQRGGRNARNNPLSPHSRRAQIAVQPPSFPFPGFPPGMPPFDPANPMPAMMAMMQTIGALHNYQNGVTPETQQCPNMAITGACADGLSCPYDHSNDVWGKPQSDLEYDPTNAVFPDIKPSRVGQLDIGSSPRAQSRGRGNGRGRGRRTGTGRQRSEFAQLGFNSDLSITTIVVEGIPDEHCNDQDLRKFYSEFGAIEEITIQPEKRLALVKFSERASAEDAYNSPKVVFDNRFVKVYMKKSSDYGNAQDDHGHLNGAARAEQDVEMGEDESFDMEEFAKRQEEVQRKHEEVVRQREEAAKQRQEVNDRLVEMEAEKRELETQLAMKTANGRSPEGGSTEDPEQTKALKAQLAQLEAEAKTLGIDPDASSVNGLSNGYSYSYPSFRGRGGYRGRGRGRGRAQYRGAGGGWAGGGRVGAVMRVDNRPKTVAVKFARGTYDDHDEAIRQFLLFNNWETATLAKHPDREDTAIVSFQQRFEAETFSESPAIPLIGKVKMSWYKAGDNPPTTNGDQKPDKVMSNSTSDPPSSVAGEPDRIEEAADEDFDRWS